MWTADTWLSSFRLFGFWIVKVEKFPLRLFLSFSWLVWSGKLGANWEERPYSYWIELMKIKKADSKMSRESGIIWPFFTMMGSGAALFCARSWKSKKIECGGLVELSSSLPSIPFIWSVPAPSFPIWIWAPRVLSSCPQECASYYIWLSACTLPFPHYAKSRSPWLQIIMRPIASGSTWPLGQKIW